MPNTIALRKQYSTLLDEVYKLSSLTSVLDGPNELVREGVQAKLPHMPQEARSRLQSTLERIINEGCDGLICILL